MFLRPVLCSALLGDSSCGFHSAAPRPAQQHSAAAEDDDGDDDDDEKMTILMNMMMTIVMITKSENELPILSRECYLLLLHSYNQCHKKKKS